MPTIAITGATGFIGSALTNAFLTRRWSVVALTRLPPAPQPGLAHRPYDLADPQIPAGALDGVDVLIHAAYVKAAPGVSAFDVNTTAARALYDAARRAGVGHAIFVSSVSAHADAVSEYGRQKFAIEKVFSAPSDTIVRPGLVLGAGGLFANMRGHLARGGRVPLFGDGRQPMQSIHIDDLTAALATIVTTRASGTFCLCEPHAVTYREFYGALSASLGQRPRFVPVPFWLMSGVLRTAAVLGIRLAVNYDNLLGLKTARAVESGPSLERLGAHVRPYTESLAALANASGTR